MRISASLTFLMPSTIVFNSSGLVVTGYGDGEPAHGLMKTRRAHARRCGGVKTNWEALKIMVLNCRSFD
jgi:hypothetical protein